MIDRHSCGLLPEKPHTVLRTDDGRLLYEEMYTRAGFDGPFSYFYHLYPITAARRIEASSLGFAAPTLCEEALHPLKRRLYDANKLWDAQLAGPPLDFIAARTPFLFNDDVVLQVAAPQKTADVYFANNDGDDLWFVVTGKARLESVCGWLDVGPGDYVHVPRSIAHRFHPEPGEPLRLMCVEARKSIGIPQNYRNGVGQLTMNAPYTHRDFVRPRGPIATVDNVPDGPRELLLKKGNRFTLQELERCPMDVVGYDGFAYPFAFPIEKFSPKIGQVHLPPTVHTTFLGGGVVICSFVPRMVDFHKNAIPCPYPHASVDCDEVLLYLRGNFTSRKGVGPGCLSLHPSGVAHGPHPGAYEASIGTTRTDELAVMVDTFAPLYPTRQALDLERGDYHDSWKTA